MSRAIKTRNPSVDVVVDAKPNVVTFATRRNAAVLGIRPPNKLAVDFALAMGDEAIRLYSSNPDLTWDDVKDLFYDACETFPVSMLDWYVRLVRDRDSDPVLFEALHSQDKSVTFILEWFRRERAKAA